MREAQRQMRTEKKTVILILSLVVVLLALILACLCIGKYRVSPFEALGILFGGSGGSGADGGMAENVVLNLRLPRVLAAVLVGGALSVSGAAYQGIFKNPLVSPDILGVTSGACVGAAAAILFSLPAVFLQGFAFITGIIAVSLSLLIPKLLRTSSTLMLVLSGIIVGGLMNSVLGFIKYLADPETQLASIVYWMMGDFSGVRLKSILLLLPALLLPVAVLFAMSWWIDVLSLGEREARSLGANVGLIRGVVIVCATLLTAAGVCLAGSIGWVGLVVPHFGRMIAGTNNTRLLPVSFLLGAVFMLLVDTLTRIIGPYEMPISILTGLVGAPFYAWLLYRGRRTLS
jgi:iron complex transport system permease protein